MRQLSRRDRLSLLLTCSFANLGLWSSPAAGQPIGPEFQVNTYTTGWQYPAEVAGNAAGSFVVVWWSTGQDGDGYGVFAQRYDASGAPAGDEFQVNLVTTGDQREPAVAVNDSGGFTVVWESALSYGSPDVVVGRRFDATGQPLGGEFEIGEGDGRAFTGLAVAPVGAGGFVVVWPGSATIGPVGSWGLVARRFDSTGLPLGDGFLVNSSGATTEEPAVATSPDGSFVVAWSESGGPDSGYDVFARRYDADGLPLGGQFQVNSFTSSDQTYAVVATSAAGDFVVAWVSDEQDGSQKGVFGQRFDSSGKMIGAEFRANVFTGFNQWFPTVAAEPDGEFVVGWMTPTSDGGHYDVFLRHFDESARPLSGDLLVNTYTSNFQGIPKVAATGSGEFVVAWASSTQDGSAEGVFGQRVRGPVFMDDLETGDVCSWTSAVGGADACP
jgi:hypothetical protein